jgi:hypothetical protein
LISACCCLDIKSEDAHTHALSFVRRSSGSAQTTCAMSANTMGGA